MAEREYLILLGDGVRKRHYHQTERGRVVRFTIQLEVEVNARWLPVIRYDCAHGFAHAHFYPLHGDPRREDIPLPYDEALTLADEDINTNWARYRATFLGGGDL